MGWGGAGTSLSSTFSLSSASHPSVEEQFSVCERERGTPLEVLTRGICGGRIVKHAATPARGGLVGGGDGGRG